MENNTNTTSGAPSPQPSAKASAQKDGQTSAKKKMGLSTKIFLALLSGAVFGVLIHYFVPASYFRDITSDQWHSLCTGKRLYPSDADACGSTGVLLLSLRCYGHRRYQDTGKGGRKDPDHFYLVTTAVAICLALGVASLISPGVGMNVTVEDTNVVTETASVNFAETLLNIIPKNIFTSLAEGEMLPVIVFALFVGIILAMLGNKVSTVSNFSSQFNDIMMEMTMIV